jgi:hypothetical protein
MLKFLKACLYAIGAITVTIIVFDTAIHFLDARTPAVTVGEMLGAVIGGVWIMNSEMKEASS